MKTLNKCLCLFIFLSLAYHLKAQKVDQVYQKKYELKLKTSSIIPEVLDASTKKNNSDLEKHCFNSYYYGILQFSEIPNLTTIQKLKNLDVHVGDYLPENAYHTKISTQVSLTELKEFNVRSVYFLKQDDKISTSLLNKLRLNGYVTETFKTRISIKYDPALTKELVEHEINRLVDKTEIDLISKQIHLTCSKAEIEKIAQLPFVYSIGLYNDDVIPLAESATVQLRGRYFHNPTSEISPKLTGKGIKIGVFDKGTMHIDLKNRSIGDRCLTETPNEDTDNGHACLAKGLVAGNGNINPNIMGMAPQSIVLDGDEDESSLQELAYFVENDAIASVRPYGNMQCPYDDQEYDFVECPMGIYDSESQNLDEFFKANPYHLGIYSAGNAGNTYTNTCTNVDNPIEIHDYPLRYNTIVHKGQTAKNTLTVSGITNLDQSNLSSSRGPTRDGRLKPELVAETCVKGPVNNNEYGTICGTSFSAPLVTGGVALLGEAYEALNVDEDLDGIPDLPKAGLLKAILCNTADDLGNPGPDFTFGFGRPNFKRAYETLDPSNYIVNTITSNDLDNNSRFSNQINLDIPNNEQVDEINITLYWPDAKGNASAADDAYKLINDLDITMYNLNEPHLIYKPYVLDNGGTDTGSNPNENCENGTTNMKHANVLNDAIISICDTNTNICHDQNGNEITNQTSDHLNNIEKITIKNPPAGNWVINIDGLIRESTFQKLEYFVVHEKRSNGLAMSYPRGGESFEPGQSFYITWETLGDYTGFEVHYKDVLNPQPVNPWIPIATTFSAIGASYDGTNLPPEQLFYRWDIPDNFPHTRVSICVTGKKGANEEDWIRVCTQESINVMASPNISQSTDYQTQQVTLQWSSVAGADKYEIYKVKSKKMEKIETVLENFNNNSFTDDILPYGKSCWYSVKAIDDEANGLSRDSIIISQRAQAIEVNKELPNDIYIKVFLEGAFDTTIEEHRTNLFQLELLPGMANNAYQGSGLDYVPPYGGAPWNYNGTEGYNLSLYPNFVSYQPTDVDWVLVSLRETKFKNSEVIAFAAILRKDGIIRLDHPITRICEIGEGPFYIVVEHRNHLPIMSPQPVELVDGQLVFDFTTQDSYRDPTKYGQTLLSNGKWAALAGNAVQGTGNYIDRDDINGKDRTAWVELNGNFYEYSVVDFNLDGDLNGEDKAYWIKHNGKSCIVNH